MLKNIFRQRKQTEEQYRHSLEKRGCFIDENGQIFTKSEKLFNEIKKYYSNVDFWSDVSEYSIDDVYCKIEDQVKDFLNRKFLTVYGKENEVFSMACGSGENEFYLAKYLKRIDGYEYSDKMVQTARRCAEKTGVDNLFFFQADASCYEISKKYDAGLSFFLFAYLDDCGARHAIKTMVNAINSNGRLYLRDTMNYGKDDVIYLYNYATGYSAAYRNIDIYNKLLTDAGLRKEYEEVLRVTNSWDTEFKLLQSVWVKA